jgi:peptidylprolyl isomerase
MTTAKAGKKVKIHYTATLDNGEVLDTSREREPLQFVIGQGQVLKGLDEGVAGMNLGDLKKIYVRAADAFGERDERKTVSIDRKKVPETLDLKIGMQLKLNQSDGSAIPVRVSKITEEKVTLDTNHPYAGKSLNFEIELLEVA